MPAAEPEMARVIAEIPSHGDFPAAARAIDRLRATVAREDCAALEVARIILADPGTASKVLRLVNSAFYRKGAEAISTISRAVMLMGFQAIRDLSTGLLLLEELLRHGRSSPFVREQLRRAVFAALFAQRLAPHVGHTNTEEAYLLGLFADWGTLWLATYHRPLFEQAIEASRTRGVPLDEAVRDVFGGAPDELAAAILERWEFPAAFADHFRRPAPESAAEIASPAARLSALVHVATECARAVDESGECAAVPPAVIERCERLFGLPAERVTAAAQAAVAAARDQGHILGIAAPHVARPRLPAVPRPAAAPPPAAAEVASPTDTLRLVAEITRSIAEQRDINQVLLMVLEGLARTGRFDVVFLALLTRGRERLVGRLGCGDGVEEYLARLEAPVRPDAGVLADVVLSGTSHVVSDGSAALLVAPGAATPTIRIASFVACPLVVRAKSIGVLVAARAEGTPVAAADLPTVELFCDQAAIALHRYAR